MKKRKRMLYKHLYYALKPRAQYPKVADSATDVQQEEELIQPRKENRFRKRSARRLLTRKVFATEKKLASIEM